MTWQQKLAAMMAICNVSLRMRKADDWYVSASGRDVGGNGMLCSIYGNGPTPEAAVECDWRQLVEQLPPDRYIVIGAYGDRKCVRWNGFMWDTVTERTECANKQT